MTKVKSARAIPEEGGALLVALLASTLLAGLGLALAGVGSVEAIIASNHRAGSQALFAADAALEAALADLTRVSNLTDVLSGAVTSSLQGFAVPPAGRGEPPMTLTQLTATVQSVADSLGSWGANQPQWRIFGHGWLTELVPAAVGDSDEFIASWVADDEGETDGNPLVDTNQRIQLIVKASSARGLTRTMMGTVEQTSGLAATGYPGIRVLAWKELR
jgi:Tfp pilus assembly protein PilX